MSLVKRQKTEIGEYDPESLTKKENQSLYENAVVLEGHRGPVLTSTFNGDGTLIVSGGMDGSILLWHTPYRGDYENVNYGVIEGHRQGVTSIRWFYDDYLLASGSADNTVRLWDTNTGQAVRKLSGHESVVNEIDAYGDSQIVSVGDDGSSILWDARQKSPVNLVRSEFPLLTCSFDKNGDTFYVAGIDPTIMAYDTRKTDKPIWTLGGQRESITSLSISPDNSTLISRSMDGIIKSFNAKRFVPEGKSRVNPFIYSGTVSGNQYQLIRVRFAPDNTRILSGSEDMTLCMWEFVSRRLVRRFTGHKGAILDSAFHPNKPIILSTSTDGTIIVQEI